MHKTQLMFAAQALMMADSAAAYDPQALLSKPPSEVKPPVKLPLGTFVGTYVQREFAKRKTQEGDKTICTFTVRLDEPMPDVEAEVWENFISDKEPAERTGKYDFWITPAALFRLNDACDHTGQDHEQFGSMAEVIEAMLGKQAVFTIEASKPDPKGNVFHNISGDAALPE